MKQTFIVVLAFLILAMSCKDEQSVVSVSLANSSSNALDWVDLEWNSPAVIGGALRSGIDKTSLGVKWPKSPKGSVTFIDERTRQKYRIDLEFSIINGEISSGKCRDVAIDIRSYTNAVVRCAGSER
jgi:hypothetical protein